MKVNQTQEDKRRMAIHEAAASGWFVFFQNFLVCVSSIRLVGFDDAVRCFFVFVIVYGGKSGSGPS